MIYGLCGASGTGKTTLAKAVAEAMSMEFVETSISGMAREFGCNSVDALDLAERVDLQEHLLHSFEELLDKLRGPAILDRTPIDLIGYLLAEVDMHSHRSVPVYAREQIASYVTRCQDLTRRRMDHIFIVQPLPNYEEAATRPKYNPAYQRHTSLIMCGAAITAEPDLPFSLITTPDHESRLEIVTSYIEARLNQIDTMKRTSLHLH